MIQHIFRQTTHNLTGDLNTKYGSGLHCNSPTYPPTYFFKKNLSADTNTPVQRIILICNESISIRLEL